MTPLRGRSRLVMTQPPALIPAAVVVDSRNVRGQAQDLFGYGREVTVQGVADLVACYGFDVHEVYVGIATQGNARKPSPWLADALQRNADYAAKIASDPKGHVLEGRLVERNTAHGVTGEEKLVDVLCAIQIARLATEISTGKRSGVIVVMSEDMDLIPAYEFASDLNVKLYVAANSTVDTRQHEDWLLIPEGSMAKAVGRVPGREKGSRLRREIASAMSAAQPRVMNFRAGGYNPKSTEVYLQHNSGATAVWRQAPAGYQHKKNASMSLEVTNLDFARSPFPTYDLRTPGTSGVWPCPDIVVGYVQAWRSPTRVVVQLSGGITKTLDASPGYLLPGMEVVVHRSGAGAQEAWRLVGSPENRPSSPGWSDPTCPVVVRVITSASSPGARVRAKILAAGVDITLQPPADIRAQAGMEFAAVPVNHAVASSDVHVTAIAVSSQLR
jgi:hypothetical protein